MRASGMMRLMYTCILARAHQRAHVQEGKRQSRGRQACHPCSHQGLPPRAHTHTHEYHWYSLLGILIQSAHTHAQACIRRHALRATPAPPLSLSLKQARTCSLVCSSGAGAGVGWEGW